MKKILAFTLMLFMALSITAQAGHGNDKGKGKKNASPGNSAFGRSHKKSKTKTVTVVTPVRYVTLAPGTIVVRDGRSYYGSYELITVSTTERYYINGKGKKVMVKIK
ncbi:MAG: hypothetical protein V4642_08620 [Bacteroidota bacterium]